MEKNDEIICFVSFILLIYLSYLGCSFFRYDSGGETLILQNQKALPFSFLVKETQSDFPKRKLVNYKVVNKFLFKRKLEIYITSKRVSSGMTKISFDISYLSSKEVKNLKISLDKVMKENSQYQDALNV
ncbi:hypothetical protein [Apibacter raozihei]|nr:hypothetical protein [Apibacter raozihei]